MGYKGLGVVIGRLGRSILSITPNSSKNKQTNSVAFNSLG